MPKIRVNNIELYYELKGSGKPVVLIGGLANDCHVWNGISDFLAQYFQVLCFDNRGMGQSAISAKPYTVDDMALDVIKLIEHLHLEKPHLVGLSLGGAIAQTIGIHYGDKVDRIVLAATASSFSQICHLVSDFSGYLRLMTHDKELLTKGLLPWLFSSRFLENKEALTKIADKLFDDKHPMSTMGYIHQVNALKNFNSSINLHKIQNKALVIYGDEDILTLPKSAIYLYEHLPNALIEKISSCGHMLIIENPTLFCDFVYKFLHNT
ncbi:MAG: alpha/beta fold hydrolase [Chlamydiales bacterium]|nr:alpha/beta fold hydrolase [Chlamydiales bacterium]